MCGILAATNPAPLAEWNTFWGHCLQGKYLEDGGPAEARLNKYRGRYAEAECRYGCKPNTLAAVRAYVQLAREAAMSPVELAIR